jgi:putative transposase
MPTWYSPTLYRRQVFTDAMLTFCEHTMGGVCADVNAELVEFNGEATCSLWRIHPQWRFPCWLNDSKAAPLTRSGASSPVCVSAPARAATSARPSHFAVTCRGAPLSIIKQHIDGQARPP